MPGNPLNTGYPTAKSSGYTHDSVASSSSHLPLQPEFTEPGLRNQTETELHPFGLFWSELEGAQTRNPKSTSSSLGKTSSGHMVDPAIAAEAWSDVYRKNKLSDANLYQDALTARNFSHMEREPSHLNLAADQLMSHQLQQQKLQERNMLSTFGQLNDSVLEHLSSQNLIHHQQQLANLSAPDLDHLRTLQLQQHQQLRLQEQFKLQQQHYQQKQKLLQEQQQSHAQKVLLEQFLRAQMHDPGLGQPHVDHLRANNVLDQVFVEQQLLHQLQQQSHHAPRHVDPSLEQLMQARFGQTSQQDHPGDLSDVLSHAQLGQFQSLEHQIRQHELLQARQLSMGLRQRSGLEEERYINSVWPTDESNQLFRYGGHRAEPSGFNPLDIYQRQQRPSHLEQLNHLERNLPLQERFQQGLYEPGSLSFEQSMALPPDASGMNLDVVNAMAHRAHGLDMQESSKPFLSSVPAHGPHHPFTPNQFHVSHMDAIEGRWPEKNVQLEDNLLDSRFQQFHITSQLQERNPEVKVTSEDSSLQMSDQLNDEKSKQLLMELLNRKSGNQLSNSFDVNNAAPSESRVLSGQFPGSSSSDIPLSLHPDREAFLNNLFGGERTFNLNPCKPPQEEVASDEKLLVMSNSRASSVNKERLEVHGLESEGMMKGQDFETEQSMVKQDGLAALDDGKRSMNNLSRHSSLGVTGNLTHFFYYFIIILSHCDGYISFFISFLASLKSLSY